MKSILIVLFALIVFALHAAEDTLFSDFESPDYAPWKSEGAAFGSGPAKGTLPGQMHVDGFLGTGLASSFHGGDKPTGTLTSPEFKIERHYISFLIGGGGFDGKTCINLLIDEKVVRTATGPNTQPGGSERLAPAGWDVAEFAGKSARIQIVDNASGGWGHISIDQIVFTDKKPPAPPALENAVLTREIVAENALLHFPIKTGARKRRIQVQLDGQTVRAFDLELAEGAADWWAPLSLAPFKGKTLKIIAEGMPPESKALDTLTQDDSLRGGENLYSEPLRGQFHFSSQRGWLNDPNGLVYFKGEWHLFYQHNPYGWAWGNMHWGHAVSPDLVHWQELPTALYQRSLRDSMFSGSAVVDWKNSSGWGANGEPPLVAAFTSTGRGECIAYSTDRGRTFSEFDGNPVVKHNGRDPRLFWHEPTQRWVLALYDEPKGSKSRDIAIYTSPDLKKFEYRSRVEGFYECPDLFPLPVDGNAATTKWLLTAASSEYMLGQFDGEKFMPESPKLPGQRGKGYYAAQTFSDSPDGRRIRIGWLQTATPGMPFNQAMSIPAVLDLATTPDGLRLRWTPVKELESLRTQTHSLPPQTLKAGDANPFAGVSADLLELRADVEPGDTAEITFTVRGIPIVYDAKKQELAVNNHKAPAPLINGKQSLIVYADRTVIEVFASGGLTYVPMPVNLKPEEKGLTVSVSSGAAKFRRLEAFELKSAWTK